MRRGIKKIILAVLFICSFFSFIIPANGTITAGRPVWNTYTIIPIDQANFDSLTGWTVYHSGSAYISSTNQGYQDGIGSQKALVVDSYDSYVEISRSINWYSKFKDAAGAVVSTSVLFKYNGLTTGSVQLGTKWTYTVSPYTETDWSEPMPLNQDTSHWIAVHLLAKANSASESYITTVQFIIRINGYYNPSGPSRTLALIDHFSLYVTEAQSSLSLSNNRKVASSIQLDQLYNIDMEPPYPAPDHGQLELSTSFSVATGDPTYYYFQYCGNNRYATSIYYWAVKEIRVTVTPQYAISADTLWIGDVMIATPSGQSINSLWQDITANQARNAALVGMVEDTGWLIVGFVPYVGPVASVAHYGMNMATHAIALGTTGTPYMTGSSFPAYGSGASSKVVDVYGRLSYGSVDLKNFIATVPIWFQYKGTYSITFQVEMKITWQQIMLVGCSGMFLVVPQSQQTTTHSYNVNLDSMNYSSC